MPIYEYICEKCDYEFEETQSIKDDPVKDCPKCKEKNSVKKLISKRSFLLKGSGWTGKSGTTSPDSMQDMRKKIAEKAMK